MRTLFSIFVLSAVAHADELVTTKQDLSVTGAPWTLVQTSAGDIEVRGANVDHVYIEARRRAPTKEEAQALQVDVSYQHGVVRIIHPKDDRPHRSVSFIVQVPAAARVQAATLAGSVEVSGTTGGVAAATQAGKVSIHDTKGELNVKSTSGALLVLGVEGTLTATTQSGAIRVAGKLRGTSTISAGAGAIDLALPREAQLHIEAATQAGAVRNDFGIPGEGNRFAGTLGDGHDGSVLLKTQAGAISVHKL